MQTSKRGTASVLRLSTEMLTEIGMKIHHVEWFEDKQIIEICFDHFTEGEDLFTIQWSAQVAMAIPHDARVDMEYDLDGQVMLKMLRPVR